MAITHKRLDAELIVSTANDTDASDTLDLLQAGALDNITLWLKDTSGVGGDVTIEQSADGTTWSDYVSTTFAADSTDSVPFRAPAGTSQYVRIKAGFSGAQLAVGT